MTTTLINVFPPNAFIVQTDNGVAFDLLSVNVVTGVVTSAYLPSSTTNFLTARMQKMLTLLPVLTAAALKVLIRNLVILDQLEGTYLATVTAVGNDYALGMSGLTTPSNLQVSVPFSTSSPFTGNGSATAASLGVTIGTLGSSQDDYRTQGAQIKVDANSNVVTNWGMIAVNPLNESAFAPTATTSRAWTNYQASSSLNDRGGREGGNQEAMWVQRPYFRTMIQSVGAITFRRIWASMSVSFLDQVQSQNNLRYVGWRYDSSLSANWFLCTSDGTTASEVDSGIPLVADTDFALDLDFRDAASLIGSINGVATTKTTNLPSGLFYLRQSILITNLAGGAVRDFLWHHTLLSRR